MSSSVDYDPMPRVHLLVGAFGLVRGVIGTIKNGFQE